jgi:hypothetical protein
MPRISQCLLICILVTGTAGAQPAPVKLNAGLEADILTLGRSADHLYLTISMKISNKSKDTVYLMLVGKEVATDNKGGVFDTRYNVAGIAECGYNNGAPGTCVGLPKGQQPPQPMQSYTEIEPDRDIVVNFRLRGSASDGPLVSFAAHCAYRVVSDPQKDATLDEADKQKGVRMMSLSFPPRTVTDSK